MAKTHAGQIVAMGGGGFSMEPDNPALDDFVLSLCSRAVPRVCFLPTASADAPAYLTKFYRAFAGRCAPTDVTVYGSSSLPRHPPRSADLPEVFAEQDVFYVGGGNTLHMLAVWRAHGIDRLLREAWQRGAILAGVSAGMICWFEASMTDSFGGVAPLHDGLGLLNGSACPHYDGEPERRPAYHAAVADGMVAGYAADDGAALHFVGEMLAEAVGSRPDAKAYRVEPSGGEVRETAITTRYLGRAG